MNTVQTFSFTDQQFAQAVGCSLSVAQALRAEQFRAAMALYAIDSPLRAAHFLAQVGHESLSLTFTRELWGPTPAQQRYEPGTVNSLAPRLGNTQPGDGQRYLGRGFIQITGRSNYAQVSKALGHDFVANPADLQADAWPVVSACWFWNSRSLNVNADADDLLGVTRAINGGTNGLDDRRARLVKAKQAFGI